MIENGFVLLPEAAHWLADYLHELVTFPKGSHDDQVDSTAQALDWVKRINMGSVEGWLEYYRRLAAGGQPTPEKNVRIKAPAGVTQLYCRKGPILSVGADGFFELTEEHARSLGWTPEE